jgi:hypothetical protein
MMAEGILGRDELPLIRVRLVPGAILGLGRPSASLPYQQLRMSRPPPFRYGAPLYYSQTSSWSMAAT